MPFPFSVGNDVLQDKLEWVAQPPPMLPSDPFDPNSPKVLHPRNTPALAFRLLDLVNGVAGNTYQGLMFFRPQGTGSGPVGSLAGLDAIGYLEATHHSCQQVLGTTSLEFPPFFVKVFIGFRRRQSAPAHIFATLQLLRGVLPDQQEGEIVEFNNVNASATSIDMDVPEGWQLFLQKTTVLVRSP